MRRLMAILTIILMATGLAWSGQLDNNTPIADYFASNQLTAKNFFDNENLVDDVQQQEIPLTGDIYEFNAKSTKKAFFYSLLIPGAGQYYAGSRVKPVIFLGIEAAVWTGYFIYHGKGNSKKDEYRQYALDHYDPDKFRVWWLSLTDSMRTSYSHVLPWDGENNTWVYNHEYFENIGKYDEFQLGWDSTFVDPRDGSYIDRYRGAYLEMRKKANDLYQNANTMIMISLANRIVSAFEAALTAKKYNKGQKRFSFEFDTKDYGYGKVPMVTWNYKF